MTGQVITALRDRLEEARLLDATQFARWERETLQNNFDPGAAGDWLVAKGLLTPYQLAVVRSGQLDSLDVGPYRVLEVIGEGGMGQVLKAKHRSLGRVVALKVIRDEVVGSGESLRRFQAEARAVATLNHPNIVLLFDAALDLGPNYLAMEFIDGTDLSRLVKEQGPLPVGLACEYVRQAALGLHHAHEKGLIHRDVKPSNLLLARPTTAEPGPAVKVLDLGLARATEEADHHTTITRTGTILGTPDYIAPEQARDSSRIDHRADQYSLGCTLYYLLTGRAPFPGGTIIQKLLMHQLDPPTPVGELRPNVPSEVLRVLDMLMQKEPNRRYPTSADAAAALAEAVRSVGPESISVRSSRPSPTRGDVLDTTPLAVADAGQVPTLPDRRQESVACLIPARRDAQLRAHSGCVLALAFDATGSRLASAGIDESIQLWRLGHGPEPAREASVAGHLGEVHGLAFLPGRNSLISGSVTRDGVLWGWDWESGERFCFRGDSQGVSSLSCVAVSSLKTGPSWHLAAAGPSEAIHVWEVVGRQVSRRTVLKGHAPGGTVVAIRPDASEASGSLSGFRPMRLAAGDPAGIVRCWELNRWSNRVKTSWTAHPNGVRLIDFSPDGVWLVTAGVDEVVRVWNPDCPEEGPHELVGLSGHIRALHFTGSERVLGTSDSGQVILWDARSGNRLREWVAARSLTVCTALSPDGKYFATGGTDGTVSIFNIGHEPGA